MPSTRSKRKLSYAFSEEENEDAHSETASHSRSPKQENSPTEDRPIQDTIESTSEQPDEGKIEKEQEIWEAFREQHFESTRAPTLLPE